MKSFEVTIPGRPAAQGRPRATKRGGFAGVYEDAKSRDAKAMARDAYVRELFRVAVSVPAFPRPALLSCLIECVFALPAGKRRKRKPLPGREWLASSQCDADNLAKLYLDAGNGVLWDDDSQVVELIVWRVRGAQDEPARTIVHVVEAGLNGRL